MTAADFQALERASPFPRNTWECDFGFEFLAKTVPEWQDTYGLDLEPDFQRAHVWTDAQRAAFVEYILQGGPSGRTLYFASKGWSSSLLDKPKMVIVDGKQRLEAVRRFMDDRLPVFGKLRSEWTGVVRFAAGGRFRFSVADIDRAQTLRWYLALNAGGTPHTAEEIDRVRRLLAEEVAV